MAIGLKGMLVGVGCGAWQGMRHGAMLAAMLGVVTAVAPVADAWAAPDGLAPSRQAAPPPPRRLDTPAGADDGSTLPAVPPASQQQYCQSLTDQIKALPPPSPGTSGAPSPTRARLEEAYRRQCAQAGR